MTNDALREREAVVAWLRQYKQESAARPMPHFWADEERWRHRLWGETDALSLVIHSIERGDHLKDTHP